MNNRDNLRQAAKDFFGLEGSAGVFSEEEGGAVTAHKFSVAPEIGESGEMVVLEPRKQTSVIAEGTTVTGRIRSSGHVEIMGKIDGNIEADGDVTVSGKVAGNIKGEQLRMLNCSVKGNLEADSRVVINSESVIIGDLNADSLVLDGKLKGNINVSKTAVFNSNSYLMGDINTSTISVDAGAVINGMVRTFVDYDSESPFDKA
jgi:cytoskeletal protein CcmA (bactofilin family)